MPSVLPQASMRHHRERIVRACWSSWRSVVSLQVTAVQQHHHSLRARAFSAMLTTAAAAQRLRQVLLMGRTQRQWGCSDCFDTHAYQTDKSSGLAVVPCSTSLQMLSDMLPLTQAYSPRQPQRIRFVCICIHACKGERSMLQALPPTKADLLC